MDAPPVRYARTSDGYDIAYAVSGTGHTVLVPPLARGHVQLNWYNDLVITRRVPFLRRLVERFRVVTFDDRGQGLSTRGLAAGLTLQDFDRDIEAVAAEIPAARFAIVGCARGAHLGLRYAIRHPERVSALFIISCPISFRPDARPHAWSIGLFDLLPSENWEFFLQTQLLPGLSPEESRKGVALLKETVTREDYETAWRVWRTSDATEELPLVRVPTLVIHPRDFSLLPPDEAVKLAASIKGASITMIEGSDFFGDADQGVQAISDFLEALPEIREPVAADQTFSVPDETRPNSPSSTVPVLDLARSSLPDPGQREARLSSREVEVLRLIAAGKSNPQIAEALVISLNTVRRHVSNILAKTGAANRTEAAIYARDRGIA